MKYLVFIVFLLIGGCDDWFSPYSAGSQIFENYSTDNGYYIARFENVGDIYQQLEQKGDTEFSYAAFLFYPLKINKTKEVKVEYRVRNTRVSVLLGMLYDKKLRDRELLVPYLTNNGFVFEEVAVEGHEYIRVIEGDLVALVNHVLKDIYGLKPGYRLYLHTYKFEPKGYEYSTSHPLNTPFYSEQ